MPITIARFNEPTEATIVRALLESAGIPVVLGAEHHATAAYPLSLALGGVAVQVPEENAAAAIELLAAYRNGDLERELEAEFDVAPETCPACGSPKIDWSVATGDKLLAAAVVMVAGVTYPARARNGHCRNCSHQWERVD